MKIHRETFKSPRKFFCVDMLNGIHDTVKPTWLEKTPSLEKNLFSGLERNFVK
jgi:hypothetical protein